MSARRYGIAMHTCQIGNLASSICRVIGCMFIRQALIEHPYILKDGNDAMVVVHGHKSGEPSGNGSG